MQVSDFIIETDEASAANRNLYYANSFGTVFGDTTADVFPGSPNLDPNSNRAISNAVLTFSPGRGNANVFAGLLDLSEQFEGFTNVAYAGIAVLITDSTAQAGPALDEVVVTLKAATQQELGIDVTVIVIGVRPFIDAAQLRSIASTGANGQPLFFEVNFFDTINRVLEDALNNVGAHPNRKCSTVNAAAVGARVRRAKLERRHETRTSQHLNIWST